MKSGMHDITVKPPQSLAKYATAKAQTGTEVSILRHGVGRWVARFVVPITFSQYRRSAVDIRGCVAGES